MTYRTELVTGLDLIHQGKVRDLFRIDDAHMLIVASDRLSAFDVVLPDPIPGKGETLTQISNFWFALTADIVPNHLTGIPVSEVIDDPAVAAQLEPRAVVVKRLRPLSLEAIVRGYLIGSGWKDYQATGEVCGIALPEGLRMADRLPEIIFTPSTKAAVGDHDENVDFSVIAGSVGQEMAERVKEVSIEIFRAAGEHALERGIIIADTKFEFGLDAAGELCLMDEVLTPDSSRFWDKKAPGPRVPQDVIDVTRDKYREVCERLVA